MERIIQWLKIGIQLFLHIAGQESQPLSCLNGRPGEDYLLHFMIPQCPYCKRYGSISFASPRGSLSNNQIICNILIDKLQLIDCTRPYRFSRCAENKGILEFTSRCRTHMIGIEQQPLQITLLEPVVVPVIIKEFRKFPCKDRDLP